MLSRSRLYLSVTVLSLTLLLAGCGDTESFVFTDAAPVVPSRTAQLAVYMIGSDLQSGSDAGHDDLLEMVDGLNMMTEQERSRLDLLVAFGGADQDGWRGIKWMNATQLVADSQNGKFGDETGVDSYLLRDEQANMADPETLEQFLRFLSADRPQPDDRFVILWNHGAGYVGYGLDENFRKLLTLEELDAAFSSSGLPKLDMLGFDACLMATVEVAATMQSHSGLMVASEETEPSHGWNYRFVVPAFLRSQSLREYGIGLVDDYVDPRNHPIDQPGKTLSLLDLEQTAPLLEALDSYGEAYATLLTPASASASGFVRAVVRSQAFGVYGEDQRFTLDLLDFLQESVSFGSFDGPAREELVTAAQAMVIHSSDDGSFAETNGLAIIPPDLTSNRLQPSLYPSSGWLSLVQASLALINGDSIAPELVDLRLLPDGAEVAFNDALLARVDVLHGFRTADGELLRIESQRAQPLPAPDRFFAPFWNGQGFYLSFSSGQAPQLLPASRRIGGSAQVDGVEVDIYSAQIQLMAADDPDRVFKDGDLIIYANDDEVFDYGIETRQLDSQGRLIIDRSREELQAGDQLKVFARSYRPGPAFDVTLEQLGPDITVGGTAEVSRGNVVPPAGTELAFAFAAVDFAGFTTVTPVQILPAAGGAAPGAGATAQVQLQLAGSGNVSQSSLSGGPGTQVQAGDSTAAPKRLVARVTLFGPGGLTRSLQLTLPRAAAELSAGMSFAIDGVQTTAAYVEASQSQPQAGKVFQAQSGRLVVSEITRINGTTNLLLSFENVVMPARALSALGTITVTGTARFTF